MAQRIWNGAQKIQFLKVRGDISNNNKKEILEQYYYHISKKRNETIILYFENDQNVKTRKPWEELSLYAMIKE